MSHSRCQNACVVCLSNKRQYADTPLNSNNKHCLFHFQWVTVDVVLVLKHAAIILSADTPLNSNNKHCLFHFQWVTVDAIVLVLYVSPTSGNLQTLHSINSNINKRCLFHFQWVMAVDAVLVLRVSPARDNTKCRHSTLQTQFVPLSMIISKSTACIPDQYTIVQINIIQK